jgi:hypothetical protein
MKQKWYIIVTSVLLLSCVACTVTFSREETPPCDITSLILEQEMILEGGESDLGYVFLLEQDSLGAQRAYNIYVKKQDVSAHHTVYQYANQSQAKLHFATENYQFFPAGWQWVDLGDAGSLALHADEWQMKCGETDDPGLSPKRCTAILRYGVYVSRFSTSISPGIVEIEDFEYLVAEIDNRFENCKR